VEQTDGRTWTPASRNALTLIAEGE